MPGILGEVIAIMALSIPLVAIWTKHRQKVEEMQVRATGRK